LTTAFRLRHTALGCYLRAGNVNLPQWGFKQIEVTCDKNNNPKDVYTHWNVEAHWNEKRKLSEFKYASFANESQSPLPMLELTSPPSSKISST